MFEPHRQKIVRETLAFFTGCGNIPLCREMVAPNNCRLVIDRRSVRYN